MQALFSRYIWQKPTTFVPDYSKADLLKAAQYAKLAYAKPAEVREQARKITPNLVGEPLYFNGKDNSTKYLRADAQAYMFKHPDAVWLAFRGTSSFADALDDVDIRLCSVDAEACAVAPSDVRVHSGFWRQFKSVDTSIMEELSKAFEGVENPKLYCVGHSLASATSSISSVVYQTLFPTWDVTQYGFGCPRVGNEGFVKWYDATVKTHLRVQHNLDTVGQISCNPAYTHISNLMWLHEGGHITYEKHDVAYLQRVARFLTSLRVTDHDVAEYVDLIEKMQ